MYKSFKNLLLLAALLFVAACSQQPTTELRPHVSAADILGNPNYPAFSYGGYRHNTRDQVPTVAELKDDMKILAALGIKLIRTYNTQQYAHAAHLLEAIQQLKAEDETFEMYVMLGTWIECEGAWTSNINHHAGNVENNTAEIQAAIDMVKAYPDIVKIIAVGNEAMVQWATNYFVYPEVIRKWVEHLQALKKTGEIPSDTWITSSDNYESWGGGDKNYHSDELAALIKAVDFVSLHTYPFHDSHYQPDFWGTPDEQADLSDREKAEAAMLRAKDYAIAQYQSAADYINSLGIEKPIHIGETGWATIAASSYGATGSQAADEYKEKLYYQHMRDWTNQAGMSCFYFEAFDERWKDQGDPLGSENHFGLINLKNEAKYTLWDEVDKGTFDGLTRNGKPITKTYNGDKKAMLADLLVPPLVSEMGLLEITTVNPNATQGQPITRDAYIVVHESLVPTANNSLTYPSNVLKLNAWEGTCGIEMSQDGIIDIRTGTGAWWGSALEIQGGTGEDLSEFASGYLHFSASGNTQSSFKIGFQTGSFAEGDQTNNHVTLGPDKAYQLSADWQDYVIPIAKLNKGANLADVTSLLYVTGDSNFDGKEIHLKNIYYSKQAQ